MAHTYVGYFCILAVNMALYIVALAQAAETPLGWRWEVSVYIFFAFWPRSSMDGGCSASLLGGRVRGIWLYLQEEFSFAGWEESNARRR